MQATTVLSPQPAVPVSSGRRALTGGVYRPGTKPTPATVTCVWCGKPIAATQKRMRIGLGTLHNEPCTPCVAEFDEMAYGPGRAR